MAFDAKVKKYSGDSAGLSAVSMMEALTQGVDYTLGIVKSTSPQNLPLFGRNISIEGTLTTGYVSGISITAGGSGYANSSTLVFSGGGGTGAQGWITLTSGFVNTVNGVGLGPNNNSPTSKTGEGYTSTPTASIANGGSGSGATFAVTVVVKDGMDLGALGIFDILKVERDGYVCNPASPENRFRVADTKSIYYSSALSPTYITDYEGVLRIYPDTTTTQKANVYCISSGSQKTINLALEEIKDNDITFGTTTSIGGENFPEVWKELVVLHAAELLLLERLGLFRTKLPTDLDADTTLFDAIDDIDVSLGSMTATLPSAFSAVTALPSLTATAFPGLDVQDPLTKAQNLIDGVEMGGDTEAESAQFWLADEDEDMVASTLSVASTELNRAGTILSEYQAELAGNVQAFNSEVTKFQQEIAKESQRTGIEIQAFQAELSHKVADKQQELTEFQAMLGKKIQLYNTLIQKVTVDYQWVTQQLQVVGVKKQEFIQAVQPTGLGENAGERAI